MRHRLYYLQPFISYQFSNHLARFFLNEKSKQNIVKSRIANMISHFAY